MRWWHSFMVRDLRFIRRWHFLSIPMVGILWNRPWTNSMRQSAWLVWRRWVLTPLENPVRPFDGA